MEEKKREYKSALEKLFYEGKESSAEFEFVATDIRLKFEKMLLNIQIEKSKATARKRDEWLNMEDMNPNVILAANDEYENLEKAERILRAEYAAMTGEALK